MPAWRLQRFKGEFAAVWATGDGKRARHRLGTDDPHEAERRAASVYSIATKPKGTTVEDLWAGYVRDRGGRAVLATMVHTWKALGDRFGALEASAISVEHCRAHTAARRAAGIQDGTIHTELGHLRMVLKWAEKQRLIDRAPDIERPAKPKSETGHLTKTEMKRLVDACTMPHARLFVRLAYATAGRSAAILGLTWDRVDFERGMIDLRDPAITAPHKGRAVVPVTGPVLAKLQEAKMGARSPYVIEWAGRRVRSVKRALREAASRAGLSHVSPHMIRHSAAVHMIEAGHQFEAVAQFLGHSNVKMLREVYGRFSPTYLRDAAAALELDDGPMEVRRWKAS